MERRKNLNDKFGFVGMNENKNWKYNKNKDR